MNLLNWGNVGAWAGITLGLISAIGYALAHDYRKALYFFFGVCITLCVISGSDCVYMRVREDTAIKLMRSLHPYNSDQTALDEFMVVHWATFVEGPR